FQAEDGIRDFHVTGVQTCALPISGATGSGRLPWAGTIPVPWTPPAGHGAGGVTRMAGWATGPPAITRPRFWYPPRSGSRRFQLEIGRASCRERVETSADGGTGKKI